VTTSLVAFGHRDEAAARADEAGARVDAPRPLGPVLLLAPSRGLGGGIERYVATLQSAFTDQGVQHQRLDLARSGPGGHRALLAEALTALAGIGQPARLVVAHRALLPVAALLARRRRVRGISVICHGSDVWGARSGPRWLAESWLMRRPDVRIVAVSSFTAGTVFPGTVFPGARAPGAKATILPPGLSRAWFGELVGAAGAGRGQRAGLELMTAFRLDDWRDKGLPQLTAAIAALGRPDVRLTVCGSGAPPADLLAHIGRFPWCRLRPGLSDRELAACLAAADLFVLATRTRSGRRACGEGFGLVLLEAQVAGTSVVGPAHGGSPGAYLDGVTGATPRDESVAALTRVLDELLREPARLAEMGASGAAWARASFAPDRYAALAVDRLL
jgi:phosphatidyl-myo-inositol dimannoside synthase